MVRSRITVESGGALLLLLAALGSSSIGQEGRPASEETGKVHITIDGQLPPELAARLPKIEDIKPSEFEIPDDPPPHEGAMIDYPITVDPPDILVVEVLEALLGRPITGERMVRPDGTISFGFYGSIHVRGLSLEQVKLKTILHLRKYLADSSLGLVEGDPIEAGARPAPDLEIPPPPDAVEFDLPFSERLPSQPGLEEIPSPEPFLSPGQRAERPRLPSDGPADLRSIPPLPGAPRFELKAFQDPALGPLAEPGALRITRVIPPAESDRVFVDMTSYNSKVYYVQGDVQVPGRLPFTGKETVLDALNYANGLALTADRKNIHLHRPARGKQPVKVYSIDLDAIERGDPTANLQLFPGDRLIVGRLQTVGATVEIDRRAAPLMTVANQILSLAHARRRLLHALADLPPDARERQEIVDAWIDLAMPGRGPEGSETPELNAAREVLRRTLVPARPLSPTGGTPARPGAGPR